MLFQYFKSYRGGAIPYTLSLTGPEREHTNTHVYAYTQTHIQSSNVYTSIHIYAYVRRCNGSLPDSHTHTHTHTHSRFTCRRLVLCLFHRHNNSHFSWLLVRQYGQTGEPGRLQQVASDQSQPPCALSYSFVSFIETDGV